MDNKIYEIEKMDHFGRGIIEINNKKVFVDSAFLGDIVNISITKDKKNYSFAKVSKYIEKSIYRRGKVCSKCDVCGGCNILELNYEKQLEFKQNKIKDILNKYLDMDIKINPIIYSNDLNYRNKITLHIKGKKIGMYKKNSNKIVEIDYCYLVDEQINIIIKRVVEFVKNVSHNLNEVTIKFTRLNENMIVFSGNVDSEIVLSYFDDIDSIFINDNCIKNKYIKEKLGDYKFILSKDSFFQVNKYTTVKLYNKIIELIQNKKIDNALDLYCGTGTITINVSKYVKKIIGIEEVIDAVSSALENKKINNVDNVEFICDKVENRIGEFNNIDLIIVDPPRVGLSSKVVDNIIKINPEHIIYVSCDPMTLVRDLNVLKEKYNIVEMTPVDMFPNTYHCESVCVLERR